jgi:hypothetical protein
MCDPLREIPAETPPNRQTQKSMKKPSKIAEKENAQESKRRQVNNTKSSIH